MLDTITVADLVVSDYRNADVFKKFGIDFCCGGKKSLSEVCREKRIDLPELERELDNVMSSAGLPSQNYNNWSPDFLAEYIVQVHHTYVAEAIPLLIQYLEKVARVHGQAYPETVQIESLFKKLAAELSSHMMKEEQILFPYIKVLIESARNNETPSAARFGSVQNPVNMMEHEHDIAGQLIKEIQRLSNTFTPPAEACNTFRVSYAKLEEFEKDLFMHIHLENNILFPKAIQLENQLTPA